MATLLKIAADMDELAIVVRLRARELTKFVCLRILEYLVRQTPADTSKAVSNWRIAAGGTSFGAEAIPAHVPGSMGSTKAASAQEAINRAREALKLAQPGKALAIINAAPYIRKLNEGWSAQHPGGFIEASILVGKRAVKEYNFNQKIRQGRPRGVI